MGDGKGSGLDFGLLVLRLALGGVMMAHGIMKLVGTDAGVAKFADFLGTLGVPAPYWLSVATISVEIGGGLLVVIGLFAPLAALGILVVMVVAAWKVHLANGFWMVVQAGSDIKAGAPIPHGIEYNVVLGAMALCIVCAGAGKIRVPVGKKH